MRYRNNTRSFLCWTWLFSIADGILVICSVHEWSRLTGFSKPLLLIYRVGLSQKALRITFTYLFIMSSVCIRLTAFQTLLDLVLGLLDRDCAFSAPYHLGKQCIPRADLWYVQNGPITLTYSNSDWVSSTSQLSTWRTKELLCRISIHWNSIHHWILGLRQVILWSSLNYGARAVTPHQGASSLHVFYFYLLLQMKQQCTSFFGREPQPTEGCQVRKPTGGGRDQTRSLHVQAPQP